MIASFKISIACCTSASWASAASPGGDRLVPLDLPGQAHGRDGILHRNIPHAYFEALVGTPERKAGQVGDADRRELPKRAGRNGDVYPGRSHAAGSGRGIGQQVPALRECDGEHGARTGAALPRVGAILDPAAPRAGPGINRAQALCQGKLLGCTPGTGEAGTIRRDHGGLHDAVHRHDDSAAGRAQERPLPDARTSGHIPSEGTDRTGMCRPAGP